MRKTTNKSTVSVMDFGAVGDGVKSDARAIQAALDSGAEIVKIPAGKYRITRTLRLPSNVAIHASQKARIFSCGNWRKLRGDFLLTNSDHENGNVNLEIAGGIWDGNNQGKYNTKDGDLFNPDAWSGSVLDFFSVHGLTLKNITVANSVVYNIRMCRLDGFIFDDIRFCSRKKAFNQDGLHFAGCCRNGVVRNVRAISKGQTNDDLIALNADDSLARLENLDLVCGPIQNIAFENISAEDCHTGIRILSYKSTISNISFRNVSVGCRCYAINADGARYCRTPLFKDEDEPCGIGHVSDITIDGLAAYATDKNDNPLICLESNCFNFEIRDFVRDEKRDADMTRPVLMARKLRPTVIKYAQATKKNGTRAISGKIARVASFGARSRMDAADARKYADSVTVDSAVGDIYISSRPDDRKCVKLIAPILGGARLACVTSEFGRRDHPVTGKRGVFHNGIDICRWTGSQMIECAVCAFRAGVVTVAESSDGPAGVNVAIDHGDGLVSRYFHLERGSLYVKQGDDVEAGQPLGWMGRTGCATGEHLHFQLEQSGRAIDPAPFIISK